MTRRKSSACRSAPGSEAGAWPAGHAPICRARQPSGLRILVAAALAFGVALTAIPAPAEAQAGDEVLVVSRKRVLNETAQAQALAKAETDLTAALQAEVDKIKAALTKEEQELARQRATLDRESFEQRVAEFDRRVRRERRDTQERAATLQNAFRDERVKLLDALGPVLEEVRAAHGANLILNTDVVLAADPALDVTDEVIARFNATVPPPAIPLLDQIRPSSDER